MILRNGLSSGITLVSRNQSEREFFYFFFCEFRVGRVCEIVGYVYIYTPIHSLDMFLAKVEGPLLIVQVQ